MKIGMVIPKFLACFVALLCLPVAEQRHDGSSDRWHGTLILAMVTKDDAVLAADSLEVMGNGVRRKTRNSCKIVLLNANSAVAIAGVEEPLQDAAKTVSSDGSYDGKSLKQISTEWYDQAVEQLRLDQSKYLFSEDEYQYGVGDAIFIRAKPGVPIEYVETRVQPIKSKAGRYQQMPEREWQRLSNSSFKMNSDGMGELPLSEWFHGQTALGKKDQAFLDEISTKTLNATELDAAALRVMTGAIDADAQKAKADPNYQIIISGPIDLLHFNRLTGKMHWVQREPCDALPPK
jgi:hypothetical protein